MNAIREVDYMPTLPMASVLHVMSDDQLDKLIKESLQRGFELGQKKPIEKPLTKKEAADYMRIHIKVFNKRFKTGALPANLRHYVDGTILFFASELEAFIRKS